MKDLNLSFLNIKALPEGVEGWTSIQDVKIFKCEELECLPPGVRGRENLQNFYLKGCRIRTLPSEVSEWRELEAIFLDEQPSMKLPEEVSAWTNVRTVHVSSLEYLPATARAWTKLTS
jgi:hypothetical protein